MKLQHFLLISMAISLFSCKENEETPKQVSTQLGDVLGSHIDSSIAPGDDFFEYANGGWLKQNKIPDNETGWGIFNLVADENYARLRKISEDATSTTSAKGTPTQQIGDFFYTAMDSSLADKLDSKPIESLLSSIENIKTTDELTARVFELQTKGVEALYALYVEQDMKNSDKFMIYLSQGGLGLPDRDYYFKSDARTKTIREEYVKHIQAMLMMINKDSVKSKEMSAAIWNLEQNIASSHKKLEDLRDPYANYNKLTTADLNVLSPKLNWIKNLNTNKILADTFIVGQPQFYSKINQLISSTSLDVWKAYLTFHTISTYAPYLSSRFDVENFHFYSEILNGTKTQRPRWKRALDAEEDALGDALGQLFVKEFFPEKTKLRYENLVDKIVESYREHIQKLDWMTDSTKQKALIKLNAIVKKVGYPSVWKDYSSMSIARNSFVENFIESKIWQFNYEKEKLTKPVDRTEWGMTPQTYNAYYNPSNNEIVLPAAIFTAPGYKDEEVDDAVIYGYVGASTIGHELTHGFDDQGRQFDEKGNLKNWWSKSDEVNFKKRADMLVKQFNEYTVLDSLHPNGSATLGENIADLGGIVIALDAFKKTKQYQEGKLIAGLTPLQRYFMGYAYGWMQTRRAQTLANQLLTDVHAPIFLRVNGPMSNCDEWYQAFDVKPTHKMFRDSASRVRIW